jgi:hypothetical protein
MAPAAFNFQLLARQASPVWHAAHFLCLASPVIRHADPTQAFFDDLDLLCNATRTSFDSRNRIEKWERARLPETRRAYEIGKPLD